MDGTRGLSLVDVLKGFLSRGFLDMPLPLGTVRLLFNNELVSFRFTNVYIFMRSLLSGSSSSEEKKNESLKTNLKARSKSREVALVEYKQFPRRDQHDKTTSAIITLIIITHVLKS